VALATNRIRVEFHPADAPGSSFQIVFEEESRKLSGVLVWPRAAVELRDAQRQALILALAGLYKLSGVDEAEPADPRAAWPSDLFARNGVPGEASEPRAFRDHVVTWRRWVELWAAEQAEGKHADPRQQPDALSQTRA
jgi:hypothetical protein